MLPRSPPPIRNNAWTKAIHGHPTDGNAASMSSKIMPMDRALNNMYSTIAPSTSTTFLMIWQPRMNPRCIG